MPIAPRSRVGPYEVLSPLGAGGMGEVYRARDTRLGRDIALKVLAEEFATDATRLKRFEREARAASGLNAPNIVTVYDVGTADGVTYIAMELVEGQTLRQLLQGGPLPIRKLLAVAAQVAEGLARAHEAGIVHRDVKPDNVMVTRDGVAKILDFGLAKRASERGADDQETTATLATEPGSVVGTVRYMSPEQAAGRAVDFRTDQFSFGSVLYEMATGKHAFAGDTKVDTLSAILHKEPESVARVNPKAPAPLRWIIERCLGKEPKDRYAATEDLARDLVAVREHLSEVSDSVEKAPEGRSPWRRAALVATAAAVVSGLAAVIWVRPAQGPAEPPFFRRLTFRSGSVFSARFAPDEQTVIYSADWEDSPGPTALFLLRLESPESRAFGLSSAEIFSISPSGELAVQLNPRQGSGTLARLAMVNVAPPRPILEDVDFADWAPDGKELAIVHDVGGRSTLEYPIGRVLYQETAGALASPKVSRDGQRVAVIDHPQAGDDMGGVLVVDRAGTSRMLGTGFETVAGIDWAPDGREVWFTAAATGMSRALYASDLAGRKRVLMRVMGSIKLEQVSRSGRTLFIHDDFEAHVVAKPPGEEKERELAWLDLSLLRDLSPDGRRLLLLESGEGGGPGYSAFLRASDGSAAIRLGEGDAEALSPDGKWALAILRRGGASALAIYPTGAGGGRTIPLGGLEPQKAAFLPGRDECLLSAGEKGHAVRVYRLSLTGGPARAIGPEGFTLGAGGGVSPDGAKVVVRSPDRRLHLLATEGGEPRPIAGTKPGDEFCGWTSDGRQLFVSSRGFGQPKKVELLDLSTGARRPWKDVGQATGGRDVLVSADGSAYAFNYARYRADLYLVEGLR